MNKFKLIIIITLFLSIITISKVYATVLNYNLLGKVIYLDPGHGGADSGAYYKNIKESTNNKYRNLLSLYIIVNANSYLYPQNTYNYICDKYNLQ